MAHGDRSGYAVTNPNRPRAFGVCDYCGTWWNRYRLIAQFEWGGDALIDQGFRVCPDCISKPQEQLRAVILPQDPVPIDEPRPELVVPIGGVPTNNLNENLNGFLPLSAPIGLDVNYLILGLFQEGIPFPLVTNDAGTRPLVDDHGAIILQEAVVNRSGRIAISGVPALVAPANAARKFLFVYNPAAAVLGVAQGTPILGNPATVTVGMGGAIMQSDLVAPYQVWQGAVYALGLMAGMPFWAWEL